jgi:hypothetical protein
MGRTYKKNENEWVSKDPIKYKVKKKQREVKPALNEDHSNEDDYYDKMEMEAYDEEFSDKIRRRGSNRF